MEALAAAATSASATHARAAQSAGEGVQTFAFAWRQRLQATGARLLRFVIEQPRRAEQWTRRDGSEEGHSGEGGTPEGDVGEKTRGGRNAKSARQSEVVAYLSVLLAKPLVVEAVDQGATTATGTLTTQV
jgi:hypothetical protein